ncbi:oocyte zinc finger protein XlCOF8.4-like [Pelobates fuscus]|uniref:oocyte zinc finger protein XlCOF8.4-like n=1 Tax=Pelobates fuscus TaxID=191477 RepID=UPI002FE43CBE
MNDRNWMTEKILDLTLEIIYLLTGEDLMVVKKTSNHDSPRSNPHGSEGSHRTFISSILLPPPSLIHERNNNQKVLELTNQIIELLTGEVSVRCEDVNASMEEWEYIEGHKDLYKDIIIENHHPLDKCIPDGLYTPLATSKTVTKTNDGNASIVINQAKQSEIKSVTFMSQESLPCEGGNLTDICTLTEHPQKEYPSTHSKEEPASCEEGNLTDISTPTEHPQKEYPSSYIKEEPAPCEEGNLTDISTLSEHPQPEYPSLHIKEEPVSCEKGNLTDISTLLEHPQIKYPSIYIKEEPDSCDEGNLTDIATFSEDPQTEYPSIHIKEEPDSCEEGNLTDIATFSEDPQTEYPSTHIKEEPASYVEGNLKDISTNTKHTETYASIHFKEDSSLHEYGFVTDSLSEQTHRVHPPSRTDECSTGGKGNLTVAEKSTVISDSSKHQEIQTEKKRYQCPECGKCFLYPSKLVLHKRIHTGEKPFKCTECGKCFNVHSNLTKHQIIHKGEKPFKCTACGKCFNLRSNLNRHQIVHKGENNHLNALHVRNVLLESRIFSGIIVYTN